jgi:hypothetical protein
MGSSLTARPLGNSKRGYQMKKKFYVIILITLFLGCNENPISNPKDESEIPVTIENLTGQWSWIKSVDSLNQVVDSPTINYSRAVSITQDYIFREYRNDTLFDNYNFCLKKTMTNYSPDSLCYMDRLDNSRWFNYVVFSLSSKSLVIGYSLPGSNKKVFSRTN